MQSTAQVSRLLIRRTPDDDLAELGAAVKFCLKNNIDQAPRWIAGYLWPHLGLKIAASAEEIYKCVGCILNVDGGICALGRIAGDLKKARVGKMARRTRKHVNAEVGSRLKDQKHAHSVGLRTDL